MSTTILVADDDPDYVELTTMILRKEGYRAIVASDGSVALEELRKHEPDVCLVDWNMPGMNGINFIKTVKADAQYCDRYVIMVTARSDPQAKAEGMNAGADDYLTKPFDKRELLARVRVGLRTRNLQKALADKVRTLDRAIEQSPVSIVITDTSGVIEYVNHYFTVVTGYSFNEAIGKNPRILKSGEKPSEEYANLWKTIVSGGEWRGEFHNRKKNGDLYWEQASVSPIKNEKGEITHFLAVKEDITERKRAEEALRHAEEKYRTIVENAVEGIYQTTPEGQFISANPSFVRCFGYESSEEMIAALNDLDHQFYVDPHRRQEFAHVMQTEGIVYEFESQAYRKDGSIVWVSENARAVRDASGKILHYEGTMVDITDRKRAEELIRQSELQFRLVWEKSADGMRLTDEQGTVLNVNEAFCRMVGMPREAIEGKPFSVIYTESQQEHILRRHQERFRSRTVSPHLEREMALWDGKKIWFETTNSFFEAEGQTPLLLSIFRDITARKRAEEERQSLENQIRQRNAELEQTLSDLKQMQSTLVQSEKMASIGQLTAGIAHEINNPLAFVSSNLNRFKEYFDDTVSLLKEWQALGKSLDENPLWQPQLRLIKAAEQQADLEFITEDFENLMRHSHNGVERIKSIVDRLRGFSHLGGNEFAEGNINEALDDTLTIAWNELKYKATIEKDYGALSPVCCNIGEIKQVFLNLVVNAAHAIQEKGTITLHTHQEGNEVVIQISDTGGGIPPANLKKIFDPFFTTKPVGKGTGLGLWISSTIVQKHQGTITVTSELGRGTTFTIRLRIEPEKKGVQRERPIDN